MPWLEAELAVVKPRALVCLGATAGQGLIGPGVRVGRDRGRPLDCELAELVTITVHPSSILRAQDDREREAAFDEFVADLHQVASWLGFAKDGGG
jgi:DNA polymerase